MKELIALERGVIDDTGHRIGLEIDKLALSNPRRLIMVLVYSCEGALSTARMHNQDPALQKALCSIRAEQVGIDREKLLAVVDSLDRPHPTNAEQAARSAASAVHSAACAYILGNYKLYAWSALCSCARTAAFMSTNSPWSAVDNQGWITERRRQLEDLERDIEAEDRYLQEISVALQQQRESGDIETGNRRMQEIDDAYKRFLELSGKPGRSKKP